MTLSATAGLAALSAVSVGAGYAGASSSSTALKEGRTTVVVAPATAGALLSHGIVPLPIAPGAEFPVFNQGGPTLAASFPVTGGSVNLSNLTSTIEHEGGLTFADFQTAKSVSVTNFDIVLGRTPVLTGYVPALHARVPVFDLSLSSAHVTTRGSHVVKVTGVGVSLDPTAAAALDSALGTTLFTGGLPIGTASTRLVTS